MARRQRKVEAPETVEKVRVEKQTAGSKDQPAIVDEQETRSRDSKFIDADPHYVRISAGMTRNLGNYESLRVDVSISSPCTEAEIDAKVSELGDKVAEKLEEEIDKYFEE